MRLILTRHARERMDYHGITEDQIIAAIRQGARVPQTDGFLAHYTYLCVAYKICGDKYVIRTVFVDR